MTDDYRPSLKKAKFRNTGIGGTWGVMCFINAIIDNYEVMAKSKILFWSLISHYSAELFHKYE